MQVLLPPLRVCDVCPIYSLDLLVCVGEFAVGLEFSRSPSWQQTFTFDRYGNRNFDEANTTTLPKECNNNTEVCEAIRPVVNPTVNTANNRLNGYLFDNVSNTIRDAEGRRFTYDGENKQVKVETLDQNGNPVSTVGEYTYDGDGTCV